MATHDSLWRLISIGYCAENKLRSSHELSVLLVEKNPFVNGEVTADITEDKVEGKDSKGNNFSETVKMSNTVTAKWKGEGSNRVSSPDVRRGERVEVWKYGNNDEYYWSLLEHVGETVRRRETVIHAFSNTIDESQTTLTPENAWVQEISTHDKVATLIQTNKSDGEKYAYTIQVNVKENAVVIADDVGNFIQLDSDENQITLRNQDGSFIDMKRKKITINCEELEINATNSWKLTSKQGDVKVSATSWKGEFILKGGLTASGGKYSMDGDLSHTGRITNNGKNIGHDHTHGGVRGGSGNTGGVN